MPFDVNQDFMGWHKLLPVRPETGGVLLAMSDPLDEAALAGATFAYDEPLIRVVALESDIDDAWRCLAASSATNATPEIVAGHVELREEAALLADQASDAPVIRQVNRLISKAIALRASDIHFEPAQDALNVRFRVDGDLELPEVLAKRWAEPVVSRLKLMAKLDIAEKRLPQDGRLRSAVQGHSIDLRLATFPTLQGESVVLRVLGQQSVELDLDRIGLSVKGLAALRRALAQPHGLVLITGPTGSGKTTTLYAALNALRRQEVKLVTVEDPIEYTLAGVSQLQVKPEIGLDYPAALRSVLRNDPDVIMVGEIRDKETADIAIRAALTGHLVLATLHTNSAAGAVTRLLDLGVQDFLLASTLEIACAQRLVRKLCSRCARQRPAVADELALLRDAGLVSEGSDPPLVGEAQGCPACLGRGFAGRIPLFEAITMSESVRVLVRAGFDEGALNRAALSEGAQSLLNHGLHKVLAGETTVAEVLAVAGAGEWRAST
jgi:general secretion pathway protein E